VPKAGRASAAQVGRPRWLRRVSILTRVAVQSCHCAAHGELVANGAAVVALVGAANVGKSTLFNALTGARREVGNWPGTTVEVGRGRWRLSGEGAPGEVTLLDLPGAGSLDPLSPDEVVTRTLLVDVPAQERPDLVLVVVDASRLTRSLYLVAQLREFDLRIVVGLTMNDVATSRGVAVDIDALSREVGVPVVALDPRRRAGLDALAAVVSSALDARRPAVRGRHPAAGEAQTGDELAVADERFAWVNEAVTRASSRPATSRRTASDRVDAVLTAPVRGPLIFLAAMWAVFQVTTTVAAPLQRALDSLFTGPVSRGARSLLGAVGLGHSWIGGFVLNGIIAGVGMLLTFVPLMALMFLLLAVLEDSGYMARAAVVTDRLMRTIGLPGRAFLPLVVGFGCNVPAVTATRVLPDARHRLMTTLLVPFTSCTARLTVYLLVAAIFFPGDAGNVVFTMYLLSILLVIAVGYALRATLWRTMGSEPLVIDLPPYQLPTARLAGAVMWLRLRGFLRTAGGIIVAAVAVVWLLQMIPTSGAGSFGDVPVQRSLYAGTARTVAPAFAPAGFGDWQAASALIVGFVAKEAVVSSWSQTYAAAEPKDVHSPGALGASVKADFERSSGGHTTAAAWAFLIFILAYTPCVATLATQKREIGARWTAFGVGLQLSLAWSLAVVVFQVGRLLG
jgi:ferrous iron transport protein B